jgi:hypothetical protein
MGMEWRKSSVSGGDGTNSCVEVAWPAPKVAVRDSKNPSDQTLAFPSTRWTGFLRTVVVKPRIESVPVRSIASYVASYEPPHGTGLTLDDAAAAVRAVRGALQG